MTLSAFRHPGLVSGSAAVAFALLANPLVAQPNVPNPDIPCWLGERSASAGEDDFVHWDTSEETKPYLISHDREQMREGGVRSQADYNYLIYWFGHPSEPNRARHYLGSDAVSLLLPEISNGFWTLDQARHAVPISVMCYLQKRFGKIDVLTENGYEELWTVGNGL